MEQATPVSQFQTPDVSDVKPPEEFDQPASIIANSEYDTYEAHLVRLQSTYSSGKYTVVIVIYTVIFYKIPYRLKNFCTAQLYFHC